MTHPRRPSALRRPLSSSATPGSGPSSSLAELLKAMPPPRSLSTPAKHGRVTFSLEEAIELASDFFQDSSVFGKAMLEQTRALTLLVSQLAANSNDPLQDLGSSSSSLSSRGTMGRAKLQNELAAHKGVFFSSVLQQMARRMQPSQQADVTLSELRQRGATPPQHPTAPGALRWLWEDERFGIHHLAGCSMYEPYAGEQPPGCNGCAEPSLCLPRTSGNGQWGSSSWALASVDRGPTPEFVYGEVAGCWGSTAPFAPTAARGGSPLLYSI